MSLQQVGADAGDSTGKIVENVANYFSADATQTRQDVKRMKEGKLGISEAQQNQMAQQAQAAAQAQQGASADAIRQQAAASGQQNSAAATRALGQLGKGAGDAAAQARMQASIASGEQARASREAILARSKADTSKYAANASTSIAKGGSAAGGFLDMMGGAGGAGSNTDGLTDIVDPAKSTGGMAGNKAEATSTAPATSTAQPANASTAAGMNDAQQKQAQNQRTFGTFNLFG